ncbi:MAG TPA: Rieske 2Fe-2S domain-containing protein [Candidatus Limnocylindrales bacterium]|nr:Rieske 2Fe-2S domain-containing protein [Candidatus Limnocylindrales bacterium]
MFDEDVEPVRQPRRHRPGPELGGAVGTVHALLPVRFFFGATFLYAGLDKLIDPRFLDPSSPASIQAQMIIFIRASPIAALVRLGQPLAVPIGLAIAIAEIAIGLGALTGLAYRAAAWGGAILSLIFFLTASWATRPYYYGPDLPYAIGWVALASAGHGGLFVSRRLLAWAGGRGSEHALDPRGRGSRRPLRGVPAEADATDSLPLRDRRTVLQAGVLGFFALIAASVAVPFRISRAGGAPADGGPDASAGVAGGSPGASSGPGRSSAPQPSAALGGLAVARVADLAKTGARAFTVPFSAPAPFPAGDPAVIVKLADGSFVAFDAVCTHEGCTVQWDRVDRVLLCPCHSAAFDPAHDAAVLQGPTNQPLASIPIVVDAASGTISLRA